MRIVPKPPASPSHHRLLTSTRVGRLCQNLSALESLLSIFYFFLRSINQKQTKASKRSAEFSRLQQIWKHATGFHMSGSNTEIKPPVSNR